MSSGAEEQTSELDPTGKVSLDHLYVQHDPRAYFGTLGQLDFSTGCLG
jgi:hypothetical protein